MALFLTGMGCLCLIYFLGIALLAGHGTNFFCLWLIMGVGCLGLAFLMKKGIWQEHIPVLLRRVFWTGVGILTVLFCMAEGFIISGFQTTAPENVDALVVLGAQMKAEGPSRVLQYRLDAAVSYLQQNPKTLVIVSGGQGSDEHISEAQGMYDYLVQKGIEPERILKEDRSVNTVQNLTFSAALLDKEKNSVAIVTNNFHLFRSMRIAQKLGYAHVYGIAAKGYPFLQPNNMLREFFGVVKDFAAGNI